MDTMREFIKRSQLRLALQSGDGGLKDAVLKDAYNPYESILNGTVVKAL